MGQEKFDGCSRPTVRFRNRVGGGANFKSGEDAARILNPGVPEREFPNVSWTNIGYVAEEAPPLLSCKHEMMNKVWKGVTSSWIKDSK